MKGRLKMRIAVASSNGENVDLHFGKAKSLFVYEYDVTLKSKIQQELDEKSEEEKKKIEEEIKAAAQREDADELSDDEDPIDNKKKKKKVKKEKV